MQETFDAIAEVMGVDAVAVSTSERVRPERSEVERLFSNNSKAREMLGWSPDFAGVEGFKRGLAETAEWFRDPANLRRYRPDIYTV
jgi:nucleoside-diphosphate-sugar epimerase